MRLDYQMLLKSLRPPTWLGESTPEEECKVELCKIDVWAGEIALW